MASLGTGPAEEVGGLSRASAIGERAEALVRGREACVALGQWPLLRWGEVGLLREEGRREARVVLGRGGRSDLTRGWGSKVATRDKVEAESLRLRRSGHGWEWPS